MTNEKSQIKTWPKKIYLFPRDGNKAVMKEIPTYSRPYLSSDWLDNPIRFSDFASVEYVRCDLAKEQEEKLLNTLKEARCDIEEWAAYASDYFREKHNLSGLLAHYDVLIKQFEEIKK